MVVMIVVLMMMMMIIIIINVINDGIDNDVTDDVIYTCQSMVFIG